LFSSQDQISGPSCHTLASNPDGQK
jgi:hypothetical protein